MENESSILYYVDKDYLKYLHKEDYRVSVKFNNRPFAGIVTLVGEGNILFHLHLRQQKKGKMQGKIKEVPL